MSFIGKHYNTIVLKKNNHNRTFNTIVDKEQVRKHCIETLKSQNGTFDIIVDKEQVREHCIETLKSQNGTFDLIVDKEQPQNNVIKYDKMTRLVLVYTGLDIHVEPASIIKLPDWQF